MGKPPLFRQRWGSSAHQSARLGRVALIEPLEDRLMLAANAAAANVFAQFEGNITAPSSTVSIPLHFSNNNFRFSGKSAVLGVQIVADGAGALDPAVVRIKDAQHRTIKPIFSNPNLTDGNQSLALAKFSSGNYTLIISSDRKTTGSFSVNLFLAGDANGDGTVNAGDLRSISRNLGRRDTHSDFPKSADANLNGVIDSFDIAQATANINDKTTLKVLTALSTSPQSAHLLPDGTFAIASSPLTLAGKAPGKLTVSLDRDGDGFDDGNVRIAKNGAYSLPATLSEGLNTLRVRVADSLGQQRIATVSITFDPVRPSPVGVAASVDLDGEANDVVIVAGSPQLAYIATGSAGLAIVDVTVFDKPLALGQIDLPGNATSLAIDSRLHIAAVATGPAGLQLVNVADSTHPAFLQTIGTDARTVAVVDGIAYVASAAGLESYDLLTAEQLQTLPLEGGAVSLAVEGSTIYTMDATNRLRIIDISGPSMVARGSLITPEGGGKIFVTNQIAYIAASNSSNGGFDTVDVSDPDSPALISASDIASNNPAGNAAIAANGSGLAIEVGQLGFSFGGASILDVFNTSELANNADSVRRIILPDGPSALALASGIAFVADGTAGLQVINYTPFDNSGNAPAANLQSLTPDAQPATPGLQAVEGTTVHLKATVADDVQVRWIDLLVNGKIIATADSLPFDFKFNLPKIAPRVSTITAQIRATDSGGNTALSNLLAFNLIPDPTAPTIVNIDPPATAIRLPTSRSVLVNFSESMDASTLTAQNIRLLDIANHAQIPIDIASRRDGQGVQLTYDTLPVGSYQIVINTAAIKDRAGHAIGVANVTNVFKIVEGTIIWTNPAGGEWSNPANWNLSRVPNATDDVFISAPAGVTISHTTGADTVHSLRAKSPFTLSGGTLTITSRGIFDDALTLSGGTLNGAGTITTNANLTWSGTSMEGPGVTTISTSSAATIPAAAFPTLNSRILNINGTLNLGSTLNLSGNAALNNGGTLNLLNDASLTTSGGNPTFINSGALNKSTGAGTSTLAIPFTNIGATSVATGNLLFNGGGSASGSFTADASTNITFSVNGYTFSNGASLGGPGMFHLPSGTISITGAVSADNLSVQGATVDGVGTLTINNTLNWSSGIFSGTGTTTIAPTAAFNISSASGKGINNRTINNQGTLIWTGSGGVFLTNGSTFNNSGSFSVQNDSNWTNNGGLPSTFNNSGSLSKTTGAATSNFNVTFNNSGTLSASSGTIGLNAGGSSSGIFSPTTGGAISFGGGTHTLDANSSLIGGGTLSFASGLVTLDGNYNFSGTVSVTAGTAYFNSNATLGNLTINGSGAYGGSGTVHVSGAMNWTRGTINAGPAGAGTTIVNSGGTLTISGTLNKTISHYSLTNAGTGSWSGIGNLLADSATFNNSGTFSVQTTARWQDTSTGSIFTNSGILNLGTSTGPLNIFGNFTQTSAGQLNIDLGGTAAGAFDTLAISGTATLAGTLNLSLMNGFAPSAGNTFQIISAPSITGTFDTILGADAAPALLLALQYNPANVTVLTQAI